MKSPGKLLLLLLLLGCSNTLFAQDTLKIGRFFAKKTGGKAILKGKVSNPETGEPLTGASVLITDVNVGTSTNDKGEYALIIPLGLHRVEATYLGLEPIVKYIDIYDDGVVDFGLSQDAYSLREIVIEAAMDNRNVRSATAGVAQLKMKEIRALPSFMGEVDVVKSLLTLPGVNSVGEGASGFNVRGGRIDQNLVQLNGAALYNASHVLGFFSAFNPDVIDQFTLYKGNVPAQYGGRASAVLDVIARNGDYEEYSFKGGIGVISSRFMAEGPIIKDKTSFLIGGRASYSDWVLDLIQDPNIQESGATFSDLNVILSHRFNLSHSLTLSYYGSTDDFQYSKDFGFTYGTRLAGLRWNGILGSNFSTSSTFNYGDYDSRSFIPEGVEAFNLDNGIEYYQFKQNFFWLPQGHKINFGLEVNGNRMKPDVLTPRGEASTILPEKVRRDKSRDFALYFNDEYTLSERISISAGLRYSLYQQLGDDAIFVYDEEGLRRSDNITDTVQYSSGEVIQSYGGLEPRLSLRLGLDDSGDKGAIKMSYNRTRQYIHLISNSAAPTPVDIWQVSNPYIEPQIGDNFSIGYFKNFNSNVWESFVELYYKNLENLVDFRDFPDLLLNEHIETELLSGQGRAYGLEFYLRRLAGRWTGWLSYTYSRSEIQIPDQGLESGVNNGEWYPANFDQPHTVNLVAKRQLGKRSALSFNFTYQTGRPITGLVASYTQNNSPIPNFSERNAYRVPDYVRFDMSLTISGRTWPGKKFNSNVALSVYNLFGRRNAFSVFYQRPENSLIPRAFQLSVLGAVFPAVTYNFSF